MLSARAGCWRHALARLVCSAQPPPTAVIDRFAEMTSDWRQPPGAARAPHVAMPLSFGILRPTILLSPGVCRPGAEPVLRWVLTHELTHLERRDAWSGLLFAAAQTLYFFVPWLWWLRRQARLCQEFIADAAACPADAAADYAQFLLNLRRAPQPARALGVLGNPSDLYRRVTMLLQSSFRIERGCPRGWSVAVAALLIALAALIAGLGVQAQANPTAADPTTGVARTAPPADAKPDKKATKDIEQALAELAGEIQKILADLPDDAAIPADVQRRIDKVMQRMQMLQHGRWGAGVRVVPQAIAIPQQYGTFTVRYAARSRAQRRAMGSRPGIAAVRRRAGGATDLPRKGLWSTRSPDRRRKGRSRSTTSSCRSTARRRQRARPGEACRHRRTPHRWCAREEGDGEGSRYGEKQPIDLDMCPSTPAFAGTDGPWCPTSPSAGNAFARA